MQSKNMFAVYIGAIILAIIFFYPLWVLILYSFEPTSFTVGTLYPPQIPFGLTLQNLYSSFAEVGPFITASMIRSFEVAFMVGGIGLALGLPAGYGLSKLPSSISNKIIVLLFIINMMPGLVIAIPISVDFLKIGLAGSDYFVMVGVALAQELVVLPLTVFIILGGFRALPKEIENQARVDGAGFGSAMFRLLLPMNKIAIFVAFLLSWMTSWDEFTYAVIIAPIAPTDSTFPVTLYNYVSRGFPIQSSVFALVASIPVIILAVVIMKYLKGEYLTGGLVG